MFKKSLTAVLFMFFLASAVYAQNDMPDQGRQEGQAGPRMGGQRNGQSRVPPQFAIDACSGKSQGDSCQMTTPGGVTMSGTCVDTPDNQYFACRPERGQGQQGGRGDQGQENDQGGAGMRGQGGQGFENRNPALNACKEDVKNYCSDVKPGGGRILDCLRNNFKQISQGCYDVLSRSGSDTSGAPLGQNNISSQEQEEDQGGQGQPDDQGDQGR